MTDRRPLREQLRNLLGRDRLRDDEFDDLQSLLGQRGTPGGNDRNRATLIAVAASVLLMFGVWFAHDMGSPGNPAYRGETSLRIAEEVLTNHIHMRALDLETSSMDQVRQGLDRLDFVPVSSEVVDATGLRLVGARYCTLQGRIATQLMFHDHSGEIITFYQAAYDAQRFGQLPDIDRQQRPLTLVKRGVRITIWVEQGVLVAQARTTVEASPRGLGELSPSPAWSELVGAAF